MPRHLNYLNVSSVFIAGCQARQTERQATATELSAFEIGIGDRRSVSKMKIEIRDATTLDLKCDARIKQRGRASESAIWQEEGCLLNMLTRR